VTIGSLLPFLVLIVAFYFLILRPARARQSAQAAVNSRLRPGVEVMTTSGLFGTVVEIDGDRLVLEIAEGVRVRFVAAAIGRVIEAPTIVGTSEETQASITEDDTPAG
jgi:preprotein translocase subunit YajC